MASALITVINNELENNILPTFFGKRYILCNSLVPPPVSLHAIAHSGAITPLVGHFPLGPDIVGMVPGSLDEPLGEDEGRDGPEVLHVGDGLVDGVGSFAGDDAHLALGVLVALTAVPLQYFLEVRDHTLGVRSAHVDPEERILFDFVEVHTRFKIFLGFKTFWILIRVFGGKQYPFWRQFMLLSNI